MAPLKNIKVVDFTQVVAGPVAGMLLAELGADVIKVEYPGIGDITRTSGFSKGGLNSSVLNCNRGKRSIQIDLKEKEGQEIALKLIENADVVIQSMRPGKITKLGLDYETVRTLNPDLIYVSLSGYGQDGPYADRAVYDPVLQAMCGYVSLQINPQIPFPDLMRTALIDKAVSWEMALSITAALFARERGTGGQELEIAMIDVAIAFLWPDGGMAETLLDSDVTTGTHLSKLMNMTETANGHVVYFAIADHQIKGLYTSLGHPEWFTDNRFSTREARHTDNNNEILGGLIADAFRTFSTAEIAERLHSNSVPCGEVIEISKIAEIPQVIHNKTFFEWDHPRSGKIRSPRHSTVFTETKLPILDSAPLLNEHSDEILSEIGVGEEKRRLLQEKGIVP
ncbi:MAG TPA: CoA transferase [Acidimicrobiales bacterium]|jgi:crotonobetainyl-CoA:carnitine CoA-transferase CaiB-like acyl-CoA transferase|nr:CoA transferase [Acidimicrobiales bacterium]HJM98147.1 CoA transferase [Acidimicrobiales bacterium]